MLLNKYRVLEGSLRMKTINKIALSFAVCSVLQACSSSSDMGAASGMTQTNQQQQPTQVVVPDNSTQPEPDNGAVVSNPDEPSDTATATSYDTIAPQLVSSAGSVDCDAPTAELESTMLAVINNSRLVARMCGAASHAAVNVVTWNDQLTEAAHAHAQDMVNFNFFSHDGTDGLSVSDRADTAGYNWRAVGENIAAGQIDVAEVHQGWLDSPGHCRNIMNTLYSEVGAACIVSDNTDFGSYWVVVFGDQP